MGAKQVKPIQVGLVITVSILAGGGFIYYLTYKKSKSSQIISENKEEIESKILESFLPIPNLNEPVSTSQNSVLESMKRQLKVTFNEDILDMSTVLEIQEWLPEIAAKEQIEFIEKNRSQRRNLRKTNPGEYLKLIIQFSEGSEELMEKNLNKILEVLEISRDIYEQSVISMMQKGYFQQFVLIKANSEQKIKQFKRSKLPSYKEVTLELAKQIFRFQIDILNQKPEIITNFIQMFEGNDEKMQLIPGGITAMLSDMIYEQFEVEEEDQFKVLNDPQLITDQEIATLIMQMEQSMYQLLGQGSVLNDEQFESY